jgi:hypothetical protein
MTAKVRNITTRRAEKVREIVIAHFHPYTHNPDGSLMAEQYLPVLREPDSGWGDHWVLGWEEGSPYDWPGLATRGGVAEFTGKPFEPAEFPAWVFCEPINGIELGLYPPG